MKGSKLYAFPMPAEFLRRVEEYNARVMPHSPEGVPLRISLNMADCVAGNLQSNRVWEVLAFTEHSVLLLLGICEISTKEDWLALESPLWVNLTLGDGKPQYEMTTATIPSRPMLSDAREKFRTRVPVWHWLLLRAQDAPGLGEYPVLAFTEAGWREQRKMLGYHSYLHIQECIRLLTAQGVMGVPF